MLYLIVILCVAHSSAQFGSEYYSEWQSGVDRTINKQQEFTNPSFPIRQYTQIVFPRRFSARPQVLLMHEEIQWSKGKNINYQTFVSDITINGFYINYVIWGPAIVPILTVRWIAVVDEEAEIQYVQYSYEDLYQLRQGFGQRAQDFVISYYPKYPAPKVTAFIVGGDFEIIDSLYTSIQIVLGIPTTSSMDVRFSTRDFCHVRSLTVAYFISNNYLTLAGSVGAYHNYFNQYLDNSNKIAVRAQKFTRIVPSIYTLEPGNNILAQGISGFDVNTQVGSAYLRVTCEPMISYSSTYTLIYGTRGETLLSFMQASYVLHPPGSPYHYYYKNYDWVVLKGDQVVLKEKVQVEKKISELDIK
ncbi:unnamed protein product (macronuclear) [Paramecium tetraurelia]|uniref:H-type lectin domain-containing protein n=1 Tax=Paramecium tetraurelia TaxID=5888 RepID=A0D656_PARTE|nr:uncharacterized protein GSPATT00013953001 [Paramecium tetraurelia]CAK78523.1 unnamed protein product [Paramecium tetraurelia]|eukprot:XP_001445920.1 hypothetical protein (macronuclear) [Paramecium tetraurelia strain d4-2]